VAKPKNIIFTGDDFSEDLRGLVDVETFTGLVAEVFETLKMAKKASIEVDGKEYDQALSVTLMTDGEETWIESEEGAANSRRLADWCEGYAYGLEERYYETLFDVSADRARRRGRGEDVDVDEEDEVVVVDVRARQKP